MQVRLHRFRCPFFSTTGHKTLQHKLLRFVRLNITHYLYSYSARPRGVDEKGKPKYSCDRLTASLDIRKTVRFLRYSHARGIRRFRGQRVELKFPARER